MFHSSWHVFCNDSNGNKNSSSFEIACGAEFMRTEPGVLFKKRDPNKELI